MQNVHFGGFCGLKDYYGKLCAKGRVVSLRELGDPALAERLRGFYTA